MNNVIILILASLFLAHQAQAREVSLIDDEDVPQAVLTINAETRDEQGPLLAMEQKPDEEDDFKIMDDFIRKENEKLKDIKLLNLDLEKANLELKRKEIEEKMSLLNKTAGSSYTATQDINAEGRSGRPLVKLIGIFEGSMNKQAVLSVNGTHRRVKEGQDLEGVRIRNINPKTVIIQYQDGESRELFFV